MEDERFKMKKGFRPMPGVDGWQLSNHPVLAGAAHLAALTIMTQAGISHLRKKSESLTGYLEFIVNQTDNDNNFVELLTPTTPSERGCQLSFLMKRDGRKIFEAITQSGVIADWREPGAIRLAPVPLYNTFEEVYRFGEIFKKSLDQVSGSV